MSDAELLATFVREALHEVARERRDACVEVIRKQGDKYVLMTKHRKGGKRRKLGTHSSRKSAEAQERAIHAHEGVLPEGMFSKRKPKAETLADKLAAYAGVSKEDAQAALDSFAASGTDPEDLVIADEGGYEELAAAAKKVAETRKRLALDAETMAWVKEFATLHGLSVHDMEHAFSQFTNHRDEVKRAVATGETPRDYARTDDGVALRDAASYLRKHRPGAGAGVDRRR